MNKKTGFTLIEILITVVILAAVAGVAVPGFVKARAKAEASQAAAYLRTIRTGEKMYHTQWKNYLATDDSAAIKTELGAETNAKDYTFKVEPPAAGDVTTGFKAVATKKDTTETIILKEDGSWEGTSSYKPLS
ncbi:MAG: type II secretion system protein [Candidatus Omnitrophica bacterium]|nr:type II secretion system protein [Candidatus Omnitrophota bacterium]